MPRNNRRFQGRIRLPLLLILLLLLSLSVLGTAAQETTPEATEPPVTDEPVTPAQMPPAMTIINTEPGQIVSGQKVNLSVIGTNFTDATAIRLTGYGFLTTTFINPTAITAAVPETIPAGTYNVELTDPVNTFTAPDPPKTFTVLPVPTQIPPTREPTTQAPPPGPTSSIGDIILFC